MNAIVITFVFSVYLTGTVGADLTGPTTPTAWLGRVLGIAGIVIAVLAPATGIWVDAAHRRRPVLAVLTGLAVVADRVDESHPRRRRLPVARIDPACLHGGLQRPGHGALQRHAPRVVDAGDLRSDLRIRCGGRLFRQCPAAVDGLSRVDRRRRRHPRTARDTGRRRLAGAFGDAADGRVVHLVRTAAADDARRRGARGRRDPDRLPRRLPQAVGRAHRPVAPRPQHRLLPDRQRDLPRRADGRVPVRGGARRGGVRGVGCRPSAVRGVRLRGRRGRRGGRWPASTTASGPRP